MNVIGAMNITEVKLLGYLRDPKYNLYLGGNCFSMIADDNKNYRILNFGYENLSLLLNSGVIEFPIKIHPLSDNRAIIVDDRIPKCYYFDSVCSICNTSNSNKDLEKLGDLVPLRSDEDLEVLDVKEK